MSQLRRQFGTRLKTLRTHSQLTQVELAETTGLSVSFISRLERAIDAPSFETLERLSEALRFPVRTFFDF